MEIDAVDKLVFRVIEQVAADNCDLDKVIEFVVSFSNEHSLSQEILLKLSSIFDKDSDVQGRICNFQSLCFTILRKSAGRCPYGGGKNGFSAGI